VPRVQISHSPPDGRGVPRWDAGPENQSVSEILAQAGSIPVSSAICKRRREGMAPVRKTGLFGASGFDPHRLHQLAWSHDLVAMMSACRAECESSILSWTATLAIDLLTQLMGISKFDMKHLTTTRNFAIWIAVEPRQGIPM
jgi:hypothetical protein